MAELKCVTTDKQSEAIYEYSDTDKGPVNLAKITPENKDVVIELHFNGGNRMLKIKDANKGIDSEFELEKPKKPEDTPVILEFASKNFLVPEDVAAELLKSFPDAIQRAR